MWLFYSLLSALSETAKDSFGKLSVAKTDEYTSGLSLHITTLFISSFLVLIYGIPKIEFGFYLGSFAFLFITPLWTLLYMKALKLSPLSVTLPMMAFNPVFTALLTYIFKGAPPDRSGWFGIILISLGIYFVRTKKFAISEFGKTFTSILSDKGALYMLLVAFLWSLGAHFSKLRVDGSNPLFSTFTGGLIGVLTTYILAFITNNRISINKVFKNYKSLLPLGFFYYLATILSSIALATGSAAYVFSIKRGSIVFSSISGKLFFAEELSAWKYIGLLLITLGILAISL